MFRPFLLIFKFARFFAGMMLILTKLVIWSGLEIPVFIIRCFFSDVSRLLLLLPILFAVGFSRKEGLRHSSSCFKLATVDVVLGLNFLKHLSHFQK